MVEKITAANAMQFCGWGRVDATTLRARVLEAARLADEAAAAFAIPFCIKQQAESGAGKCARIHKFVTKITGKNPRIDAQLTGDCVSRSAMQTLIMRMCCEIDGGDLEKYRWLFSPFHYAAGRVIIGKNQLRGGAGSMGGWQAESLTSIGFLADEDTGGLKYSKGLTDAWGDDKSYQGKRFRDFLEIAKPTNLVKWARTTSWNEVRDGLYHGYPQTICSGRGYTMLPRNGFHMPSGSWPHALTIYAYWENVKVPQVAIINSWGDVHGEVFDPETGEKLPPGTLLVRLEDFVRYHLMTSSAECIAYSGIDGFDAKIDWTEFA